MTNTPDREDRPQEPGLDEDTPQTPSEAATILGAASGNLGASTAMGVAAGPSAGRDVDADSEDDDDLADEGAPRDRYQ